MINQEVKIHHASQLSLAAIEIGVILGILFCVVGLFMVIYSAKFYR
ncbi:hypothetical protein ACWNT8_13755 [Pigmentibacter ruber]|nr:hypothetical protein [Pigmentibacter ruber]